VLEIANYDDVLLETTCWMQLSFAAANTPNFALRL